MIEIEVVEPICQPKYQTKGSAGADVIAHSIKKLYHGIIEKKDETVEKVNAAFQKNNELILRPNERVLIGTGVILKSMDENLEIQVRTRSGLALKKGLIVLNAPGTIDSDYRAEIGVIIQNTSPSYPCKIFRNERIAQLVVNLIVKTPTFPTEEVEREGGYGSTN